jgi:molecular chaperone GrpE
MTSDDEKDPAQAADQDCPDDLAAETDPLAELEADVAKWRELAVRTAADLDNFRKRSAREREDAIRYANQGLLEDLLPVIDNFEMGMQAAAQDKSSMIYIGMDMVRRQLNDFLGGQGVTEIPAEGRMFDPNLHEAVAQEPGAEEGRILRVHRRGFMLRDRLLRPATVVVAKAVMESDGEEG